MFDFLPLGKYNPLTSQINPPQPEIPDGTVKVKPLAQAQYDALSEDEKNADLIYAITE